MESHLCFFYIFVAIAFISLVNTQTMHITYVSQQHCYDFPKKPYTLEEFEPGSSGSEVDAMSTAP
jgi:hypothetical protein